ncbi:hypothetical protein [Paraburkholderia hospita]|uniref:hypothetical protein n=1 Tax=Paraburkholderia hospita TaxID=169430 RepID=UPI003ED07A1B
MTSSVATQSTTSQATSIAPAVIRPSVRRDSIKVEICTPAIGAELSNVNLADAALDPSISRISSTSRTSGTARTSCRKLII